MRLEARARRARARLLVAAPFARGRLHARSSASLLVAWAGAPVGRTYALLLRGRLRLALRVERDADARHAADPHRPGRGGRVPRAALQHRRRRPALRRRARRRRGRRPARRHRLRAAAVRCCSRDDARPPRWPARCCCSVPALLKTRLGVDEVVTTLLLNFIVLLFVSTMLDGPMKDPTRDGLAAERGAAATSSSCGKLIAAHARAHRACLIAIALAGAAVGAAASTRRSASTSRAVGANARAAAFAGVPVHAHDGAGGAAVGRAGRAGRRDRGGGPHRLRHARHVAGLRLQRHRDRDAGRAASARRASPRRVRRRRAGRRRQHEPRGRRADLHRRRDRRGLADRRCWWRRCSTQYRVRWR